jgi:D-3-phosphoglycerate dehydrogenase
VFRYRDVPGMIGRVGTVFGTHGVNIDSSVVGHQPDGKDDLAVMLVTTDAPVPTAVIDEIVALDGFVDGRSVTLE